MWHRRRLFAGGRRNDTPGMAEDEAWRGTGSGPIREPHEPPVGGSAWEVSIEGRHDADRIRDQVRRGANIGDTVGDGDGRLSSPSRCWWSINGPN